MRRCVVLAALAGCGSSPPPAPPLANHVQQPGVAQVVRPLVVDGYSTCVPHHVTVSLDEVPVAVVAVTCPPPPPPPPPGKPRITVTDTGSPPMFDGPAVSIPAGQHTIRVRDDVNGQTATTTDRFPAYGHIAMYSGGRPVPQQDTPYADVIVIRDDAETIGVELDVRSLLIFL